MPSGSLEVLKTAINFGADAVYAGGDLYSLRAKAKNFTAGDLAQGVKYCHDRGRKLYVTVNITAHNYDLDGVKAYLSELEGLKTQDGTLSRPDGLIISDPGVFELAKEYAPDIERHISTQANNTNYLTYRFWYGQGAKRVVSARELSLDEIRQIRENIPDDMEIESFVHGAMCISYSGRCLLSNFLAGRDANMGECTHPCRWKYYLCEETRPGTYLPVEENERGTYIFNSKDLCMIDHIPELIEAGIDSFKIEGRMKTALYAATVARAYRTAIDTYFEDPDEYRKNTPVYFEEITKGTNRRFCTGFYFGKPGSDSQVYENSTYVKDYIYYGTILTAQAAQDATVCTLEQKNKFRVGDTLEIVTPGHLNERFATVKRIRDEAGNDMDSCAHASQIITVDFDGDAIKEGDLLRGRNT